MCRIQAVTRPPIRKANRVAQLTNICSECELVDAVSVPHGVRLHAAGVMRAIPTDYHNITQVIAGGQVAVLDHHIAAVMVQTQTCWQSGIEQQGKNIMVHEAGHVTITPVAWRRQWVCDRGAQ